MRLIDVNIVIHRGSVTDVELKARLVREVLEDANWIGVDDKPIKGVSVRITRTGRRAGQGGWEVEVTRDLRLSNQPLLGKPETA